ncbi:MAG TPA: shikimate kinase [Flavobacteriaceae bacterium]|nr:shikimate kinase [Flavobacteriaceae bacterium]
MKIILLGYMGSGKTAVGKRLAPFMEMGFADLDEMLAQREERSILNLFKNKGEIYFRKLENEILHELLEDPTDKVIALGGGTPCYGNNMELIKNSGAKTIYLKSNLESLVNRLFAEKESRPLIAHLDTKTELEDFIRKHLFERTYFYQQSDFSILVDGKSIEKIVEEILLILN